MRRATSGGSGGRRAASWEAVCGKRCLHGTRGSVSGPAHARGHPPHPPVPTRHQPQPSRRSGSGTSLASLLALGLAECPGFQGVLPGQMAGFRNLPGLGAGVGGVRDTDCFSFLVASRPLLLGNPHGSRTAQFLEDLRLGSDEGGPEGWVRESWSWPREAKATG